VHGSIVTMSNVDDPLELFLYWLYLLLLSAVLLCDKDISLLHFFVVFCSYVVYWLLVLACKFTFAYFLQACGCFLSLSLCKLVDL
jgi:hypothetical protein